MLRWSFYDPESSFWSKVDRTGGPDACWIWTHATRQGYGCLRVGRKIVDAHRYSYEMEYGAVPEGLLVCHQCNQRLCVNPRHLYAGTHQNNFDDMVASGTHKQTPRPDQHGENNSGARLSNKQVLDIYSRVCSGESGKALAKEYGVDKRTISDIKNGRTWAWLTKHETQGK